MKDTLNQSQKKFMKIAIDGPAGAGKSTVAKAVAEKTGFYYLDSGKIYRACTWVLVNNQLHMSDLDKLLHQLHSGNLEIVQQGQEGVTVYFENHKLDDELRTPQINDLVSTIASQPKIREYVTSVLRHFSCHHNVVMDGRDIGTVVFPDADVKIYLTADQRIRAQRRVEELKTSGILSTVDEVEKSIFKRDFQDQTRTHSPLQIADDAVVINSTYLSVQEVVEKVIRLISHANSQEGNH